MPDPGLTDLIAAHVLSGPYIEYDSDGHHADDFYRCGENCKWTSNEGTVNRSAFAARAAHVALVVEQHTNGRITEAKQWDGTRASIEEIAQWANADDDLMDDFTLEYSFTTGTDVFDVRIATCDGDEVVRSGDWIIRDTTGEFHLLRGEPK